MKSILNPTYLSVRMQEQLKKVNLSEIGYLPRYLVFIIDIFLLCLALVISLFVLQAVNVNFDSGVTQHKIFLLLSTNILFFYLFKTYSGLIRHSSFTDIYKLTLASLSTFALVNIIDYGIYFITGTKVFIMAGLLLYTVLSFSFLLIFRVFIKQLYVTYKDLIGKKSKKKVAIIGVEDASISLGKALATETGQNYELIAFLSQKKFKNIRIAGKPVIAVTSSLQETLKNLRIDGVLIIGKTLSVKEKNQIVNDCFACNLQVFNAPHVEEWSSASQVTQQIKAIEIEDLLDREPINLDNNSIRRDLSGKTILITGAAGSIGSELVRQIAPYNPKKLILVDQAESPLYDLELELKEKFPKLNFKPVLATISNKYRMEALFKKYNFSVVFNAAAYKHVPVIERNPREAIMVNILGTVILAKLSSQFGVRKFVMVSTDKAVNPTNVMGASKRAAEMFVQSFQNEKENKTQFITTRFGNVLGSNGSVIPHFKRQIAQGGPITVTHEKIIRYFMTIPEACQLVLQAGTMGQGGEIFVFDMGKPVKILDLAKRMIRLSGFKPYTDIDIQITGLRPGEKLFEELLGDTSTTLPTHNEKIMIAKDSPLPFSEVEAKTKKLIKASVRMNDKNQMVMLLKELVPEFVSRNSSFENLDKLKRLDKIDFSEIASNTMNSV
ncbi:polysaccharide biosynthesis protein [Salinimicrobium gaetbulicola]|uniref:Polysaccharide biosynthesis protein n=1 Tax=Salinimicrobium gaetbulicola TaxID=999702 RepID=A0ABW3IEE6_9FLAO